MSKVIAAYGGGFKPPTKGHFQVVEDTLAKYPEIDEFIIYVGSGTRDGISQLESILVWEVYNNHLPMKVKIETSKAPIGDIIRLGKNNPQDTIYFVIGSRDGNLEDQKDFESRTKNLESKYPNMEIKLITTSNVGISGTKARKALLISPEEFYKFTPEVLNDNERGEVFDTLRQSISETLNENASYSKDINIQEKIDQLTQHMLDKGMNIEPLPKVEFVDGDDDNAREFLGKTAYYNPETQTITLFTEGRHPKDIVRSFSHEMIHHIQNLEGRLGNITTTNTQEDDNLNDIEAEANLKGTMTFRNWTDSLNEGKQVGLLYHVTSPQRLEKILSSNTLKGSLLDFYGGKDFIGISTTRNKNFLYNQNQIQIVLDGDKISNNYKIMPYDYWGRSYDLPKNPQARDEDEEVIKVGRDGLKDIKKYIVKINDFTDSLNENIFQKSLDQTEKEALEITYKNWDTFGGKECNNGFCDIFAKNLAKHLPGSKILSTEDSRNETLGHVWVEYEGKYFDAETPDGVSSWKDLPWMKEFYSKVRSYPTDIETLNELSKPTKNKDPFGLNQYARELAQGLEEAIVGDKIECDNCDWSWNIVDGGDDLFICHKCGHDNTPLEEKKNKDPFGLNQYARELASDLGEAITLNEGRYDKITNQVSREVFTKFKEIYDSGVKKGNFSFSVGPDDEEIFSNDLEFNLEGYMEVSDEMYQPDGGANAGYDDDGEEITPLIQVSFKIPQDPKEFKWSEVSFDIKDIVRHEIEHLTQDGENVKSGKYLEDDQLLRGLIDAKMLPKSQYFKLEKEVDAMLQGLYFRAKKSKTPFKVAILDYFDKVGLTKEEQKQILNVWRKRRKALALPTF